MNLVEQAAAIRLERSVDGAGRPAGISAGRKILAAIARAVAAHRQIALYQIDLLPILVDERVRRKYPRRKAQQTGPASAPPFLVEPPGQDLLLDAGRIARRS